MNGAVFQAYVQQILIPTLAPADIVLMYNLPAHKAESVRHTIEGAGCRLLYLPPYSPDFISIERAFAKRKAVLRAKAERAIEGFGIPSVRSSSNSNRKNAPTTSDRADMTPSKADVR